MNLVETVLALQEGWLAHEKAVRDCEETSETVRRVISKLEARDAEAVILAQRLEAASAQIEASEIERRRELRFLTNRVTEHVNGTTSAVSRAEQISAMVAEHLQLAQQLRLATADDRRAVEEQNLSVQRSGLDIAKAAARAQVILDSVEAVKQNIAAERKEFERLIDELTRQRSVDMARRLRVEFDEQVTRAQEKLAAVKVQGWTWRGPWSDTATYEPGDVFTAGGNSFLTLRRSRNIPPMPKEFEGRNPRYGLMAVAGAPGADGERGADGAAGTSAPTDGWIAAEVTWTYASATTFTAPGDLTGFFTKGQKIKLTQTTVKYFYVVAVSHAAGITTVTVAGGSAYSLANAAITAPYYSNVATPVDFPQWFAFTVGFTGFSSNPTGFLARFQIVGTTVHVALRGPNVGTSNSTGFTITGAPVTSAANQTHIGFAQVQNGGVVGVGYVAIDPGTTVFIMARDTGGSAWSNTGNKACHIAHISYEF